MPEPQMDDVDRAIAEVQAQIQHNKAVIGRSKATRLPAGRVLDPTAQARFDREVAAGQTDAPGVGDKLATAIWGGKGMEDSGNIGHDIARTARDVGSGLTFGLSDRLNPELRAQETAEDPLASRIGRASGSLLSAAVGPLRLAGAGAQGVLGMAEQAVPALASAAGRIGTAALSNGVIGAGAAGLEGVGAGQSGHDIGERALHGGLWGAGLGGGLHTVAELGKGAFPYIRNTVGGKLRELIEKYGGQVGPSTSGEGGAFEQELKDLPATEEGVKRASRQGGPRLNEQADALHEAQVKQPYKQETAQINPTTGQELEDIRPVIQQFDEAIDSPRLTVAERKALITERNDIEKRYSPPQPPERARTDRFSRPRDNRLMAPAKEVNDLKIRIQGISGAGQSGEHSVRQGMTADVADKVKSMVDEGPYAEVNAKYHEGTLDRSRLRSELGLGPKDSSNPFAEDATVSRALQENARQAPASTLEMQAVKEAQPELAREVDLPAVMEAKRRLQFQLGLPGHGNLATRAVQQAGTGALGFVTGNAAGGHGVAGTAMGLGLGQLAANAEPIAGRLLYGPARSATNLALRLDPKLRAMLPGSLPAMPASLSAIEEAYREALSRLGKGDQQ